MDFRSNDLPTYPGSTIPALKADFAALDQAALRLGVTVTNTSDGSFYSPERKLINIDTKTPNQRGFVSLGQLTDEYLHAWNQTVGRGRFLPDEIAKEHRSLGGIAERRGTSGLGTAKIVCAFHQLEALNFVKSDHTVPQFIWRAPLHEVRQFAYAWEQFFG